MSRAVTFCLPCNTHTFRIAGKCKPILQSSCMMYWERFNGSFNLTLCKASISMDVRQRLRLALMFS